MPYAAALHAEVKRLRLNPQQSETAWVSTCAESRIEKLSARILA
ncbi:hypothetical protein ATPR_0930 [Acetobacter tropicalis NBRC 101654]|uniref:Uncharacterized protein n=1 Tax=Acetobacter tropicalis NBRC 101654 TaxID=749388 RepID=F7VC31_9PROT|nr:hypothetical protein ATPR_0930 [Acetobacter tropicalis NBRC 101654]